MPRPVPLRGVIEGFYGPPWSPEARLTVIEFVAERGMNAYVYAPKSEPKHRERWRAPYDTQERARFENLVEHTNRLGVRLGFALSPGLDIDYRDKRDRDALVDKLAPLVDTGIDWFVLALDDIPNRPGLAGDQAALTSWLVDALRARRATTHVTLVPTEYVGTRPTSYLRDLATGLPPDVDVMWTGPTVCSPVVRADDARARAAALGGRRPILWDNFPVNDGTMERSLHLGPYLGREPELTDEVDGVLCNPMLQAHASQIGLATAADFLREPEGFDGLGSWFHAIADVEGERRGDLSLVARACADGPLQAPRHIEMHSLVNSLEKQIDGPGWHYPVRILDIHLSGHVSARHGWADAPDDPLGAELDPWLADMETEAKAGLAAVRLIQQTFPVARWSRDGHGKAALPDPELAMLHAFALLYSWRAARRSDHVVFGPRFAVYPAVVQLADDVGARPGVDVDLAVVEDESAIDRLCRLALDRYRAWTREPPTSLRVTRHRILDPDGPGIPVEVAPDGTFDAPREKFGLLVEAGPDATELLQDEDLSAPPFPDARLD